MKRIFCLALVLFSWRAIASGQDIGNGGDVLVCSAANQQTAVLLDVYEATNRYHLTLDIPTQGDFLTKARLMLERFAQIDQFRAANYLDDLADWFTPDREWRDEVADVLSGVVLEDIPDDQGYLFIPLGCEVQQIVIQSLDPEVPGQKRFTINVDLWNQLDAANQAALLVHELIYAEAIREQAGKAWRIRYLNAHVLSTSAATMSLDEYRTLLENVDFLQIGHRVGPWRFEIGSVVLHANGSVASGFLTESRPVDVQQVQTDLWFAEFKTQRVHFSPSGEILGDVQMLFIRSHLGDCRGRIGYGNLAANFFANGRLQTVVGPFDGYPQEVCVRHPDGSISTKRFSPRTATQTLSFYHDGQFKSLNFHEAEACSRGQALELAVHGSEDIVVSHDIELHQNGYLARGTLCDDETLMTTAGDAQLFRSGEELYFDTVGRVIL